MARIAIAEDHALLRNGYQLILEGDEKHSVVTSVANGLELLEELKHITADIVLLDLEMPVMNGKETFIRLKELYPDLKIIILTTHYEDIYISQYYYKGANGFLSKSVTAEELLNAINCVTKEGIYFDAHVSNILMKGLIRDEKEKLDELFSHTELLIIKMIADEKTSEEIATKLGTSISKVIRHRKTILEKANLNSNIGLIKYAIQHGIAGT